MLNPILPGLTRILSGQELGAEQPQERPGQQGVINHTEPPPAYTVDHPDQINATNESAPVEDAPTHGNGNQEDCGWRYVHVPRVNAPLRGREDQPELQRNTDQRLADEPFHPRPQPIQPSFQENENQRGSDLTIRFGYPRGDIYSSGLDSCLPSHHIREEFFRLISENFPDRRYEPISQILNSRELARQHSNHPPTEPVIHLQTEENQDHDNDSNSDSDSDSDNEEDMWEDYMELLEENSSDRETDDDFFYDSESDTITDSGSEDTAVEDRHRPPYRNSILLQPALIANPTAPAPAEGVTYRVLSDNSITYCNVESPDYRRFLYSRNEITLYPINDENAPSISNLSESLNDELNVFMDRYVKFANQEHKEQFRNRMDCIIQRIGDLYVGRRMGGWGWRREVSFGEVLSQEMALMGYMRKELVNEDQEIENILGVRWEAVRERREDLAADPLRRREWDRIVRDEFGESLPLYEELESDAPPGYEEVMGAAL